MTNPFANTPLSRSRERYTPGMPLWVIPLGLYLGVLLYAWPLLHLTFFAEKAHAEELVSDDTICHAWLEQGLMVRNGTEEEVREYCDRWGE